MCAAPNLRSTMTAWRSTLSLAGSGVSVLCGASTATHLRERDPCAQGRADGSLLVQEDLYNYAKAAVAGEPAFLAGIDWTDKDTLKRDSVSTFVDRLVREQDDHQDLLLALLVDVANMSDFPQLTRVEDAAPKIKSAQQAVAHLKS